jgi:hypothetical protein
MICTGFGGQTADISWWPKHSAWAKSGLNVGYWSRSCEEWYQKRLQSIHSNTAQLRTGRKWKDSIAFQHQAQKFNTTYSLVAGIFLNDALKNPH